MNLDQHLPPPVSIARVAAEESRASSFMGVVPPKILTWASVNRDDPEEWAQFCCELYIEGRRNIESYQSAEDDTLDQLANTWVAAERAIASNITKADLDQLYLQRRALLNQKNQH